MVVQALMALFFAELTAGIDDGARAAAPSRTDGARAFGFIIVWAS